MRLLMVLVFALGSIGCASYFKRKECEKTNMYQHGYNVAMSGKRLDTDSFVKDCQKAEAKFSFTDLDTGFKAGMSKYCNSDNVFAVGKAGKPFSYDMCDGESIKKMRARYTDGIRIFCTPSSAFRFGSSGGVYENVCPKEDEEEWLVQYRKGRKIYLKAVIDEKEREVVRLDREVQSLERQRSAVSYQQAAFARSQTYTTQRQRVYDPVTRTYTEKTTQAPNEEAKRRNDQFEHEISSLNYKIQTSTKKQQELNDALSTLRTEMATL